MVWERLWTASPRLTSISPGKHVLNHCDLEANLNDFIHSSFVGAKMDLWITQLALPWFCTNQLGSHPGEGRKTPKWIWVQAALWVQTSICNCLIWIRLVNHKNVSSCKRDPERPRSGPAIICVKNVQSLLRYRCCDAWRSKMAGFQATRLLNILCYLCQTRMMTSVRFFWVHLYLPFHISFSRRVYLQKAHFSHQALSIRS